MNPRYTVFKLETQTRDSQDILDPESEQEAATILEDLMRTKQPDPVTMSDITRRKMDPVGMWVEGRPPTETLNEIFVEQVKAVRASRNRIKNLVEARGEFQLSVIGEDSEPSERSKGPTRMWAFILRQTVIGQKSDDVQVEMSLAKIDKITRREVSSGVLTIEKAQMALNCVEGIKEIYKRTPEDPEPLKIEE